MATLSVLLALCEGNPSVTGKFPSQRANNKELLYSVFIRLNKLLNKQSSFCWFVIICHVSIQCNAKLLFLYCAFNTLGPSQIGRHIADDIFRCIYLNENLWISIKISLKFVLKGQINNIPVLVQIMAWRRPGDKPLCEAMMVNLPTHMCVSRPQWVN